jgi:hypothetical protein
MTQDQAPRRDYPDDPVTATPEEVADEAADQREDQGGGLHPDLDLTGKADTTKQASVEPPD